MPVTLADFNHFTLRSLTSRDDHTLLNGTLSLPGIARVHDSVYLYRANEEDIPAAIIAVDPDHAIATLKVFTQYLTPSVVPVTSYPVYDTYWFDVLHSIIDAGAIWTHKHFAAPHAFVQRDPATGCNVSRPVKLGDESRTDGHIIPGGWDHEHCILCNTHIDADHPDAYVTPMDQWVCPNCYHQYVKLKDLSFVFSPTTEGACPEFTAIEPLLNRYDLPTLRRHLDEGNSPDVCNPRGWTPLMLAAHRGHLTLLSLLLDHGANPSATSPDGYTPLALAAQSGHYEITERLLAAGATTKVPPNCFNGSILTYLGSGPGYSDPRIRELLESALAREPK